MAKVKHKTPKPSYNLARHLQLPPLSPAIDNYHYLSMQKNRRVSAFPPAIDNYRFFSMQISAGNSIPARYYSRPPPLPPAIDNYYVMSSIKKSAGISIPARYRQLPLFANTKSVGISIPARHRQLPLFVNAKSVGISIPARYRQIPRFVNTKIGGCQYSLPPSTTTTLCQILNRRESVFLSAIDNYYVMLSAKSAGVSIPARHRQLPRFVNYLKIGGD